LIHKVIYHDVAGNTFMVDDQAVNNQRARKELEHHLHKSLMVQATPSSPPRMFRPRRMSMHRGDVMGVVHSPKVPIDTVPTTTTNNMPHQSQLQPSQSTIHSSQPMPPMQLSQSSQPVPATQQHSQPMQPTQIRPPLSAMRRSGLDSGGSGSLIESPTIRATVVRKRSGTAGSSTSTTSSVTGSVVPNNLTWNNAFELKNRSKTPSIDLQPNSRASSAARAWTAGRPESMSSSHNGVVKAISPTQRSTLVRVDGGSSVVGTTPSHVLDTVSADTNQVRDSYSIMMAEYPKDGMSGLLPEQASASSTYQPGTSSHIKFDASNSNVLNDSVDIRSCVLLGNPQPFRTWRGEVTTAPRNVKAVSKWLQKISGEKNESTSEQEQRTPMPHDRVGNVESMDRTSPATGFDHKPRHQASSREFHFQTKQAQQSNFAKITAQRLKAHVRQFRQDTGFSLWMRKDVSGYIEDRGHYNLERLSLKAKDFQIKTNQKYKPMDTPKNVLNDAHQRMNDQLEKTIQPLLETHMELKQSFLLPSVIVPNSTGQHPPQRNHAVSTIHHLSEFIKPTPAPIKKYVVVPFKEMMKREPYVPPPVVDSTSGFQPICGITYAKATGKYQRRYALPVNLPEAKSVVGLGFEMSTHVGKDAEEAAAVQAALACRKRNVEYKLKKLRNASRRGGR
jgi:hypothetical protein